MKGQATEIWQIYNRGKSTLEIPVYQRNYDWGILQCSRLFDDLERLARADRREHPKHFFGAVVGKPEGSFRWIVIDGQQRLTTISLLILALAHAIENDDIDVDEEELGQNLVEDYLLIDGNKRETKFKLKPVKNDAAAYQALFGPQKNFIDSSNITANYRFFRKRLEDTDLSADMVWDAISRLEIMHLDLEEHDDPQRIFESLNSTGLDLSEADKIRNFVLMNQHIDEQERLYEERWNPLEKNVDYRTDWFIRWYLVSKTSRTPKESDVFEAFKIYAQRAPVNISHILDEMHDYSKYCRDITKAATGIAGVDRQLRRMLPILGDVTLPFLMPVLRDTRDQIISEADLLAVLEVLESYLFRRITCTIATNALNKIFATAYSELQKLRSAEQSYADLLMYMLRRRDGGSGRFPNDAEFQENFATRDSYRLRSSYRRYLFDALENGDSRDTRDIAASIANGDLTVEHIMPQKLTEAWREELGSDYQRIHDIWQNRIANLTVTGYNSAYSNSSFQRKKTMQQGFNSSPYRLNSDVKNASRWGEEELQQRSQRLTAEALEYWPFIETSFAPPEVILPTEPMGDEAPFRGRTIVAYQFNDANETVGSWRDMIIRVVSLLLQQNRQAVLEFALQENQLVTDVETIKDGDRRFAIVDPGLAVFVSTNTMTKIELLRRLFSYLDLETEELVFTLKPLQNDQEETTAEEAEQPQQSLYAPITKFLPQFQEATTGSVSLDDTADLRKGFSKEFAPFKRDNPMAYLDGQSAEAFSASTPVRTMAAEQILALISLSLDMAQMMGPSILHQEISNGRFSAYLEQLTEFDQHIHQTN